MTLSFQFSEYVGRTAGKITSVLNSLIINYELYFYKILKFVSIMFVGLFSILIIPVLVGSDYESILKIAEFGIIGSGTLAILIFTYSITQEKIETDTHSKIVKSGELFLKSSVTLIMGLGLLPQVGFIIRNHADISSPFGIFAPVYDAFLLVVTMSIMVIGIISLVISASFFVLGIIEIIEVFESNLLREKIKLLE